MTDKKIEQGDLQKALETLQDLAKGHSSKGTATTQVESMVGESGATQIFHTPSNSDPGSWAGSSWRGEGWEDSIDANGTDLNSVKKLGKSIAAGVMAKLSKGATLSAREIDFVSKGGLNFLKDKDEDKEVEKAHSDEAEDKKLVKEMVKPDAVKKSDVSKSFADHASDNSAVSSGVEVSEFLAGLAHVMHKSLASMEARVTDRLLTAMAKSASETGEVQKSMAEAVATLGEVLTLQAQRLDQVESSPARAPKSATIAKSMPSDAEESLTKSQINARLLELVQKGQANSAEVLKYDATGEISDDLYRKVRNVGR